METLRDGSSRQTCTQVELQHSQDVNSPESNKIVRRRSSQISESCNSTTSNLTATTNISQISDSFRSCILRLKHCRQQLNSNANPSPQGCSFLGRPQKRLSSPDQNLDSVTESYGNGDWGKTSNLSQSQVRKAYLHYPQNNEFNLKGMATFMTDSNSLHKRLPPRSYRLLTRVHKAPEKDILLSVKSEKVPDETATKPGSLAHQVKIKLANRREVTRLSQGNKDVSHELEFDLQNNFSCGRISRQNMKVNEPHLENPRPLKMLTPTRLSLLPERLDKYTWDKKPVDSQTRVTEHRSVVDKLIYKSLRRSQKSLLSNGTHWSGCKARAGNASNMNSVTMDAPSDNMESKMDSPSTLSPLWGKCEMSS